MPGDPPALEDRGSSRLLAELERRIRAVDASSFEELAAKLTVHTSRGLLIFFIGAALLVWPLGAVLHGDDERALAAIAIWRWGLIVISSVPLILSLVMKRPWMYVMPITLAHVIVISIFHGYVMTFAVEFDEGFVHFSHVIPTGIAVLLVPLWYRVLATGLGLLAFWAAYFLLRPAGAELNYGSATAILSLTTVGASIPVGHLLYVALQAIHRQRTQLAERARELEELDRLRTQLIANVSHELRTPLTLILAAFRRIRSGESDSNTVRSGLRNSARLLVLIQQLLDAARASARQRDAVREQTDVAAVARDVVDRFRPSEPDTERFSVSTPSSPLWASVDSWGLRTMLYNLVDNALKFTDAETRCVRVAVEATEDLVTVEVDDNGVGIRNEDLPHVFDSFRQADGSLRRSRTGAGVGLALVRDIARSHDGEVEVESHPGRGTRMTVVFPRGDTSPGSEDEADELAEIHGLAQLAPTEVAREPNLSGDRPRVVLAEDDAELRAYAASVLGRRFDVEAARNGREALALLEAQPAQLAVLDVMMPELDGLSTAQQIQSIAPDMPILILTALSGVEARRKAYAVGAADYVSKPFDEEELIERAANLIRLRGRERSLSRKAAALEARVDAHGKQVAGLAARLATARDDERARLSRDLHDETAQLATGLRLELALLRRNLDRPLTGPSLGRIEELLDDLIGSHRRLIGALRPAALEGEGLDAAVRSELMEVERRTGARTSCRIDENCQHLELDLAAAVFRAIQEALTNVTRHAGANSVEVEVRRVSDRLEAVVRDDGDGFEPQSVEESSYGLRGMRERALAFGGELRVESSRGEGTCIEWAVPMALGEASAVEGSP